MSHLGPLLCLKCRSQGHRVDDCPLDVGKDELLWPFSPARQMLDVWNDGGQDESNLCGRCADLNVVGMLAQDIPWTGSHTVDTAAKNPGDAFRTLGKTGSIELWAGCSLCLCIFGLTGNPSSPDQDVFLVPYWTIHRLEREIVINGQKRKYSKCLMVVLLPAAPRLQHMDFEWRALCGDALCLVENGRSRDRPELGGQVISNDTIDVQKIEKWLECCNSHHPLSCTALQSDRLRCIRLLDVSNESHPQLVPYPEHHCDYMALSYVWGDTEKQSFQVGPVNFSTLPKTFKDAITLVRRLGKKYLWIDFMCIDQRDEEDKKEQIDIMADIYRGASATIIAISGRSANSGLPRMSGGPLVPQLRCSLAGRQLVGTMVTLRACCSTSTWAKRAWTLQEGLLSRRRIYITEYQMYFECNAMQCSESLDDSHSQVHQLFRDEHTDTSIQNIGAGFMRHVSGTHCNRATNMSTALQAYAPIIFHYSWREMRESKDAINAISGILADLEDEYGTCFHWGLPVDNFHWGLLWTPLRSLERRPGFPSWSWAGCSGPIVHVEEWIAQQSNEFPTYLSVYQTREEGQTLLFKSRTHTDSKRPITSSGNDPITDTALGNVLDATFDITSRSVTENEGHHLVIEGVVLHFNALRDLPMVDPAGQNYIKLQPHQHLLELAGVQCGVHYISADVEMARRPRQEDDFLLVARHRVDGWIMLFLLLLDFNGGVAERVSMLMLSVPEQSAFVLAETKPEMRRFILR